MIPLSGIVSIGPSSVDGTEHKNMLTCWIYRKRSVMVHRSLQNTAYWVCQHRLAQTSQWTLSSNCKILFHKNNASIPHLVQSNTALQIIIIIFYIQIQKSCVQKSFSYSYSKLNQSHLPQNSASISRSNIWESDPYYVTTSQMHNAFKSRQLLCVCEQKHDFLRSKS